MLCLETSAFWISELWISELRSCLSKNVISWFLDLQLGEVSFLFISYNITISWQLNRFRFICFVFRDSEINSIASRNLILWHWTHIIMFISHLRNRLSWCCGNLGRFPFVWKNRSFRWEIKWNGPFHWKFFGKKEYLQRYSSFPTGTTGFSKQMESAPCMPWKTTIIGSPMVEHLHDTKYHLTNEVVFIRPKV